MSAFTFTTGGSAAMRRRVVACIGIVFAGLSIPSIGRADEAWTMARLKKVGFHFQTEGKKKNPGPVWFCEALKDLAPKATEADLVLLKEFPKLRYLNVSLRISDAGMKTIGELPNLETLHVTSNKITDLGIWHLRNLTRLKELFINGTRVTDAGLKYLTGFKNLESLVLTDTAVTDAGMADIRRITSLTSLLLSHTRVGDAGVRVLADLPKLEILGLEKTRVTDAGMRELQRSKSLRSISVYYTRVTDKGAAALKHAIPNLSVNREPDKESQPKYAPRRSRI